MPSQAHSGRLDRLSLFLKRHHADAAAAHGVAIKAGFLASSIFLCNNLIYAYVTQSSIIGARNLFDEIPHRNSVSWSTMISGYVKAGELREAVKLFRTMRILLGGRRREDDNDDDDFFPVKLGHVSIIKGSSREIDRRTGNQLHCSSVKLGVDSDSFLAATLIDFYWKCGDLKGCKSVFDCAPQRDAATWTTMISAFVGQPREVGQVKDAAFSLFRKMIGVGVWPVGPTFAALVKIFDHPSQLNQAKQVHGCLAKLGVHVDDQLVSALVTMYGKCGGVDEVVRLSARARVKDMVFLTSLLTCFIKNGFHVAAAEVLREMVAQAAPLDGSAMAAVIGAFSAQKQLRHGEEAHGYSLRNDLSSDSAVVNALINLYAKCGQMEKATAIFSAVEESQKDPLGHIVMLTCYAQNGLPEEATLLFRRMLKKGVSLHPFSATAAVRACAAMAAVSTGEQIHSLAIKAGISSQLSVENSFICMYGKCGDPAAAAEIFNLMAARDKITWNSMIGCCAEHGFAAEAIVLFYQMQREGFQPDDFSFLGVLTSCSRSGLVNEGREFFKMMSSVYATEPKTEHRACMIDLLGRAGRFDEAVQLVNAMPIRSSSESLPIWESLLGSCSIHREIEVGSLAMHKILEMDGEDASAYVILSNISAATEKWEGKAAALTTMRRRGLRKEAARSWVEVNGRVHAFSPDEKSHPELFSIYLKLEEMRGKMEEEGYVAETHVVRHDTSREEREISLLRHSEKMALAFVLVATGQSLRPVRIMQNLRCCVDCHVAMKLMSKIEGRRIVLRDTKRFHTFVNGVCSCGDYW